MIREFSVGCSKTVNLGNYNSIRVEASLTLVVPERTTLEAMKPKALEDLRLLLEDVYRSQLKEKPQKEPAKDE